MTGTFDARTVLESDRAYGLLAAVGGASILAWELVDAGGGTLTVADGVVAVGAALMALAGVLLFAFPDRFGSAADVEGRSRRPLRRQRAVVLAALLLFAAEVGLSAV